MNVKEEGNEGLWMQME